MRRIALILCAGTFSLSACTTLDTRVTWEQRGSDCVYTEQAGEKMERIMGGYDFDERVSKTITYPNMQCNHIIEAELKAGVNKNQNVAISKKY